MMRRTLFGGMESRERFGLLRPVRFLAAAASAGAIGQAAGTAHAEEVCARVAKGNAAGGFEIGVAIGRWPLANLGHGLSVIFFKICHPEHREGSAFCLLQCGNLKRVAKGQQPIALYEIADFWFSAERSTCATL